MAVRSLPPGSPAGGQRFAEALGIFPVLIFLGILLWLLFVGAVPDGEAGRAGPMAARASEPEPAFNVPATGRRSLIVLTTAEARAEELQALIRAESALRELLEEERRDATVIVAPSAEDAARIIEAVHADAALSSLDLAVDVVVVP